MIVENTSLIVKQMMYCTAVYWGKCWCIVVFIANKNAKLYVFCSLV